MKKKWNCFILLLTIILIVVPIKAGELRVTNEHPFLVDGSWISAKDLEVGDLMMTVDGKFARITGLIDVHLDESFKVYNLEASVYHDFVVEDEGVVVHNSNPNKPRNLPKIDLMHELENEEAAYVVFERYLNGYSGSDDLQRIGLRAIAEDSAQAVQSGVKNGKAVTTIVRRNDCGEVVEAISFFESDLANLYGENVVEIGLFASKAETADPKAYLKLIYELIQKYKAQHGGIGDLKAVSATNWQHSNRHLRTLNLVANRVSRTNPSLPRTIVEDGNSVLGQSVADDFRLNNNVEYVPDKGYLINGLEFEGQSGHLQLSVNLYDDVATLEKILKIYLETCN